MLEEGDGNQHHADRFLLFERPLIRGVKRTGVVATPAATVRTRMPRGGQPPVGDSIIPPLRLPAHLVRVTESMVGRRGLEPRTSAVTRPERCASRVERPSVMRCVMWPEPESRRQEWSAAARGRPATGRWFPSI
jgi:hypothetical protein